MWKRSNSTQNAPEYEGDCEYRISSKNYTTLNYSGQSNPDLNHGQQFFVLLSCFCFYFCNSFISQIPQNTPFQEKARLTAVAFLCKWKTKHRMLKWFNLRVLKLVGCDHLGESSLQGDCVCIIPPDWLNLFSATFASHLYELRTKVLWVALTNFVPFCSYELSYKTFYESRPWEHSWEQQHS